MHLLCIFVFCFSCLDFFAFQYFLHSCVLISPLCLLVFAIGNTHTCALNYSEKTIRNSFCEITSEKFVQTSVVYFYLCSKNLLFERS
jgi:hypothetical protein